MFVLGGGLPPVPAKLVGKILKGESIDMAKVMWNKIKAEQCHCGSDTTSNQPKLPQREIPDIYSAVSSVLEYLHML